MWRRAPENVPFVQPAAGRGEKTRSETFLSPPFYPFRRRSRKEKDTRSRPESAHTPKTLSRSTFVRSCDQMNSSERLRRERDELLVPWPRIGSTATTFSRNSPIRNYPWWIYSPENPARAWPDPTPRQQFPSNFRGMEISMMKTFLPRLFANERFFLFQWRVLFAW